MSEMSRIYSITTDADVHPIPYCKLQTLHYYNFPTALGIDKMRLYFYRLRNLNSKLPFMNIGNNI